MGLDQVIVYYPLNLRLLSNVELKLKKLNNSPVNIEYSTFKKQQLYLEAEYGFGLKFYQR